MIRPAARTQEAVPAWHAPFLAMLPAIRAQAHFAFQHLDPESRQDAVQETIANAMVAFVRLAQLGRTEKAFPMVLVRSAAAQIRSGRQVGNRLNIRDVLSPHAQIRKRITVERLDRDHREEGQWIEAVVQDYSTPILDQVAFRCDFPAWLKSLPRFKRRIAEVLAVGHSTGEAARRFHVSPGEDLADTAGTDRLWLAFHGETPPHNN